MTAAKLVLEPIFESDFLPSSFGFRPERSAHHALDAVRQAANRGMLGRSTPTSPPASTKSIEMPSSPNWDDGCPTGRC